MDRGRRRKSMSARTLIGTVCLAAALIGQSQVNGPGTGGGLKRFRGDVPVMLIRAIRAQPNLRYTGTYTVEFRQGPTPMRHQEYITRDGSKYRIEFPGDSQFAGQVIVEDQNTRLHYHPVSNEIIQQPPRHGEAWEKVANLATDPKFQLNTTNGEVIAGLKTDQLVVSDKSGNVLQRLFIEPGSGLVLKRQIFDLVGTSVGYFEFTQIDLAPKIDPQTFVIKRKNAVLVTPLAQYQRIAKTRGFSNKILAPASGFQLESANYKKFAGVDGLVQTYVNGRIRLWIYQLKAPVDPTRLRQQAGKNSHFFAYQSNGETVVLLGNLPERDLERFVSMMSSGTPGPSSKL